MATTPAPSTFRGTPTGKHFVRISVQGRNHNRGNLRSGVFFFFWSFFFRAKVGEKRGEEKKLLLFPVLPPTSALEKERLIAGYNRGSCPRFCICFYVTIVKGCTIVQLAPAGQEPQSFPGCASSRDHSRDLAGFRGITYLDPGLPQTPFSGLFLP